MPEDMRSGSGQAGIHPALPDVLKSRFKVLSRLKDVGDRQVFLLQDHETGAYYALKSAPGEELPGMQREYDLLLRLHDAAFPHPAFCFLEGERAYLLREYVPGRTLEELVEGDGPLPGRRAVEIARKVCAAVDKLQVLNPPVVHRDIKPQNFLVDQDGGVHLIDLDAAEEYNPEKPFDTLVIGTSMTAAPEQFGYRRCDARTDVYAVGMLLVFLLTGGYDKTLLKQKHISCSLLRLIDKCLEFDPDRRPASARQLMDLMDAWKRRWVHRFAAVASIAVAVLLAMTIFTRGEQFVRYVESASILASEPVHTFSSPLIERAVRLQLDRPDGNITKRDLMGVTELYLCAETPFKSWSDTDAFGGWAETAQVGDLSDLGGMPNLRMLGLGRLGIRDLTEIGKLQLTRLCLTGNDISDLTPILGMKTLQRLDIAANPVFDLGGLEACPILEILNISMTQVTNLSALEKLHLKELYMYDMNQDLDASALARLNGLESIAVRGLNRGGINALLQLKSLKSVLMFSCDVGSLAPLQDMPDLFGLFLWGSKPIDLKEIAALKALKFLELTGCALNSIEALRGNAMLEGIGIGNNPLNDFSVLNTLTNLTSVTCSTDQREQIEALSGKIFDVTYQDK